jgi:hypothetical protein
MITTKGMELTPKLSIDMLPFSESSVDAPPYGFFYQNTKERFWQPRGVPGEEEGMKNEEEGQTIYRENSPPTP